MTSTLAIMDSDIVALKDGTKKVVMRDLVRVKVFELKIIRCIRMPKIFVAKVEDLSQQLLSNHVAENERITLLLHQLSDVPPDPFG